MDRIFILIQGPSNYVEKIKECWKGFNLIFSTWEGSENMYKSDDLVIFSKPPIISGPCNLNYQKISTLNGLLKAKELGCSHVLKIRSDLIPTNASKFLSILDFESLNFLCWADHKVYKNCGGYLVDYLMFGPVDEMIKLWTFEENFFCNVPEVIITSNYINKCSIPVTYFLKKINKDNDIFWIKRNIYLSSYDHSYSLSTNYLNKDYLN